MRVFALSDIHVDYPENLAWLQQLSKQDYQGDALIVAGDVTHVTERLALAFTILVERFSHVFYVPGNHELWIRNEEAVHSLEKFERILDLCKGMGVLTQPLRLDDPRHPVWIVPLFSWYTKPGEGADSLHINKQGAENSLSMWSDEFFVRWPAKQGFQPTRYFLALNEPLTDVAFDAPIISFSHFLPRLDLVFSSRNQGVSPKGRDLHPSFNFSSVAGSSLIEEQIRRLGSCIHIYGHQHRNRWREVDGVTYVSHCLGYARERELGLIPHLDQGPLSVWDTRHDHPYHQLAPDWVRNLYLG